MGCVSMETGLHGLQNIWNILHMNDGPMRIEHLDKPTHVSSLELLGQVHEEADGGHGVLQLVGLVPDLNWKAQVTDPYLIDAQLPMIALALLVGHRIRLRID